VAPDDQQVHPVVIQDGLTREPILAFVTAGVTEAEAETVDLAWERALYSLLARILSKTKGDCRPPEHLGWSWRRKIANRSEPIPPVFFALRCGNDTQGMMAVTTGQPSRIPIQIGAPVVYIEYISTAPWNLNDILSHLNDTPRYRAIGSALLATAVQYSRDSGFGGRIGLHALPQAEGFYRDACEMTDLGYDREHDLRYFEFTEKQAQRFFTGDEA